LSRRKLPRSFRQVPSYPLWTHSPTKNKNVRSPVRVFLHRAAYFWPRLRISCFGCPLARSGLAVNPLEWNWGNTSPHTVQSDTTRCGVSRVGHAAKRPR
jgi:hypothetical protein